MTQQLEGRVALVTGAGNGLGRAIAMKFAAHGAIVGVNDLRAEFTARTVAAIRAAGGQAEDLPGDASGRDAVRELVLGLKRRHGRFDVIVNNAAWVRYEGIETITEKTYDRMTAIGFGAVVWGIQAAAEAMDGKGGVIINIASTAAQMGLPNAMLYCGIKAGVTGLTRSAATDLGAKGIRVVAIAPGPIGTEAVLAKLTDDMLEKRAARSPLHRLGDPDDIAEAALYLASDASRYVTGSVLTVDGGIANAFL